ncbi:MAG: DUF2306 domain-containing protein [Steroidobacteraceae bacterium]
MNLALLAEASLPVQLHVYTVVPAFGLGAWLFLASRKGSLTHRVVGVLYMALMTLTSFSAVFIESPGFARIALGPLNLGWIHLFVPLTLISIALALRAIRRGHVAGHRRALLGSYIGGALVAGVLAFTPGRLMHSMFLS